MIEGGAGLEVIIWRLKKIGNLLILHHSIRLNYILHPFLRSIMSGCRHFYRFSGQEIDEPLCRIAARFSRLDVLQYALDKGLELTKSIAKVRFACVALHHFFFTWPPSFDDFSWGKKKPVLSLSLGSSEYESRNTTMGAWQGLPLRRTGNHPRGIENRRPYIPKMASHRKKNRNARGLPSSDTSDYSSWEPRSF